MFLSPSLSQISENIKKEKRESYPGSRGVVAVEGSVRGNMAGPRQGVGWRGRLGDFSGAGGGGREAEGRRSSAGRGLESPSSKSERDVV